MGGRIINGCLPSEKSRAGLQIQDGIANTAHIHESTLLMVECFSIDGTRLGATKQTWVAGSVVLFVFAQSLTEKKVFTEFK